MSAVDTIGCLGHNVLNLYRAAAARQALAASPTLRQTIRSVSVSV
jgi:hypothetical protein